MAKYKVSYKVLSEQGNELKKLAKLVSTYGEKVNSVRGKLGDDQMLAEVRNNLQKFSQQMEETRAVLNLAGELLSKSVEAYTQTESRGVKKVDNTKAHKRDFYKQPVVVASVGGAAAGGAAASAAAPAGNTTINYTETTNISYTENVTVSPVETAPVQAADPIPVSQTAAAGPVAAAPVAAAAASAPAAEAVSAGMGVGAAGVVAAGLGGAAVGAGATLGASHIAAKRKKGEDTGAPSGDYDPEAELNKAMERVRRLEEDDD